MQPILPRIEYHGTCNRSLGDHGYRGEGNLTCRMLEHCYFGPENAHLSAELPHLMPYLRKWLYPRLLFACTIARDDLIECCGDVGLVKGWKQAFKGLTWSNIVRRTEIHATAHRRIFDHQNHCNWQKVGASPTFALFEKFS